MPPAANSVKRAARSARAKDALTTMPEIAAYVGRSVRTIQRWEEFYDFPVHRDVNGVHAFPHEIDAWMIAPLAFRTDLDVQANRRWNDDLRKDASEAMTRSRELRKQAQSERAQAQRLRKRA